MMKYPRQSRILRCVWCLVWLGFWGWGSQAFAEKKEGVLSENILLDVYNKQLFWQHGGKVMRSEKRFLWNMFSEDAKKMLEEAPASLAPLGMSKLWLGLLVGSLSVSILSFGGSFGLLFFSQNVFSGAGWEGTLFAVLLVTGLVLFPASLACTLPLGQSVAETADLYNQGVFEKAISHAHLTASQRTAWLRLEKQRIYADKQGWMRKGKARLAVNSAWHEQFLKKSPKALKALRGAWSMRLAGVTLLGVGGLAMLGGITAFALDPMAILGAGGQILIPPGVTYGLWAGGLVVFATGLLLEISAQNTYQRTLSAYNRSLYRRVLGLGAKKLHVAAVSSRARDTRWHREKKAPRELLLALE